MKNIATLLLVSILFSGCSFFGINLNPFSQKEPAKKELAIPNNAPNWLIDPSKDGFIATIGAAKPLEKDTLEFQKKRALINASNNYLKKVYKKSYLVFKKYEDKHNILTTYDKDLKNLSQHIALNSLKKSKKINQFISKEDGTFFVRIVLKKDELLKEIVENANKLYKKNQNFNNTFLSKKGQSDILNSL